MKISEKLTQELYEVAKTFVERVEKGEVRSTKTYNQFKSIIEQINFNNTPKGIAIEYHNKYGDRAILEASVMLSYCFADTDNYRFWQEVKNELNKM